MRRAEEIIAEELAVAPELRPIFEALVAARLAVLERIRELDTQLRAAARKSRIVRLFMTAPGIGPIIALAVAAAFDDASRFPRSSSAGAYLGLTPKRYESGETSQNGRISKRGDRMTRTCLYEAANALMTRNIGGSGLRDWALALAGRTGPSKAKVALARKLAVMLHAMWRTGEPFKERCPAWRHRGFWCKSAGCWRVAGPTSALIPSGRRPHRYRQAVKASRRRSLKQQGHSDRSWLAQRLSSGKLSSGGTGHPSSVGGPRWLIWRPEHIQIGRTNSRTGQNKLLSASAIVLTKRLRSRKLLRRSQLVSGIRRQPWHAAPNRARSSMALPGS
jgi:hypothetical protein